MQYSFQGGINVTRKFPKDAKLETLLYAPILNYSSMGNSIQNELITYGWHVTDNNENHDISKL